MIKVSQSTIAYTEDGRTDLPITTLELLTLEGTVARLKLEADGTCYGIWVETSQRRKGYATFLWRYAQFHGYAPKHSAERTVDGQAWAASLNEPLPELVTV